MRVDSSGIAEPADLLPGGQFQIGADKDFSFVFDNEKWAHPVQIKPFRIARTPVTNGEFLSFVEAGGYRNSQFWSTDGWDWLETGGAPELEKSFSKFFSKTIDEKSELAGLNARLDHPIYWRREANGRWTQRVFDQYFPLNENMPVCGK